MSTYDESYKYADDDLVSFVEASLRWSWVRGLPVRSSSPRRLGGLWAAVAPRPIPRRLPNYDFRATLPYDVGAALATTAVVAPEAIAFATIAGVPVRSADIEVPRTFFSPASWGLWAAVVSAADPSAIGSRVAPGWVAESWRRILREHVITLDPKVSLRSLEASEELLLARFIDIASTTVDGFLSFRSAADVCGRLVPSCSEGTSVPGAGAAPRQPARRRPVVRVEQF